MVMRGIGVFPVGVSACVEWRSATATGGMKQASVIGMKERGVEKRRSGGVIGLRCWWGGEMCTSNLWARKILTGVKDGFGGGR